jgi:hypothetical protein
MLDALRGLIPGSIAAYKFESCAADFVGTICDDVRSARETDIHFGRRGGNSLTRGGPATLPQHWPRAARRGR